ncbi:hypothetical protein OHN73_00900 [Streptomyces sp. NBC_00519]
MKEPGTLRAGATHDRTEFAGAGEQRAGLAGRDRRGPVLTDVSARLHERVEVLALDQRLHGGQQHRYRPARVRRFGKGLDGGEEQRVACEDRRRNALRRPECGPASAQRILVDDVVVEQAGVVHEFHRHGRRPRGVRVGAHRPARQQGKGRAHALADGRSVKDRAVIGPPAEMQPRNMPDLRRQAVNPGPDQRPHQGRGLRENRLAVTK